MSGQRLIDAFEFAAAGTLQRGVLTWPMLPRLQASVAAEGEGLHYAVEGRCDPQGRSWLRFEASGRFGFVCQRCLEPMSLAWNAAWDLELAVRQADVDAASDDPEAPDRILADAPLALAELVEDEVLLSVPFAPRHEDCTEARPVQKGAGPRESAFAGLRTMIDETRPAMPVRTRK